LNGILLSKEFLYLRWEIELPELKKEGEIVGADQGIKTCMTLSDGQFTQELQGHDLDTITNKLARKKKGSKAFHKALEHRNNYIGWSIKQLNLRGIKEVRLEKVTNFRHGKRVSKKLNYFGEPLILKRMEKRLGLEGVLLTQEDSAYKSQRCSNCSIVLKRNRKRKRYSCKHCFFQIDADLNSSLNQKANLPSLQLFIGLVDNKRGFFWKEEGIFDATGRELTVPVTKKGK
jgi:transposase